METGGIGLGLECHVIEVVEKLHNRLTSSGYLTGSYEGVDGSLVDLAKIVSLRVLHHGFSCTFH